MGTHQVVADFGATRLSVSTIWKVTQKQCNDDKICAHKGRVKIILDNLSKLRNFCCRYLKVYIYTGGKKTKRISSTVKLLLTKSKRLKLVKSETGCTY